MTRTHETAMASTSEIETPTPNLFTFCGRQGDTQVTYSTTSITGEARFTYHDETRDFSATGEEISTERGPLGTLVTVTLEVIPDLHTLTATLVLPDLGGLSGPVAHFRTFLVLTTNRTTIGGPNLITGALQLYDVIKGRGTAQQVLF